MLSFPGSPDLFHYAQRYAGFHDALAKCPGVQEESRNIENDVGHATWKWLDSFGLATGYYVGNRDLVAIASALEKLGKQRVIRPACIGFTNTDHMRPFLERGVVSAVIDENRYQVGYFAVQKAYEAVLKRAQKAPVASVQIPSTVIVAANAGGDEDSLKSAFEVLVRQRTEILVSYKRRLEEANERLLDLTVTDPLTGLYNRRRFEETLKNEISRALRYGPLSLLMIDLDRFKTINDQHGHLYGDEALKAVARVLQASCRTTDTCARLGGDEFAVILPHTDARAATVVQQRIREQIARAAIQTPEGEIAIGLSIGIASVPADAENADGLVAAADAAMYEVKQSARLETAPLAKRGV